MLGSPIAGTTVAIVAAVDLMQEAAVPGERQPHLELQRVGLAVGADARIDGALDDAGRGQALVGGRGRGAVDFETVDAEVAHAELIAGDGLALAAVSSGVAACAASGKAAAHTPRNNDLMAFPLLVVRSRLGGFAAAVNRSPAAAFPSGRGPHMLRDGADGVRQFVEREVADATKNLHPSVGNRILPELGVLHGDQLILVAPDDQRRNTDAMQIALEFRDPTASPKAGARPSSSRDSARP